MERKVCLGAVFAVVAFSLIACSDDDSSDERPNASEDAGERDSSVDPPPSSVDDEGSDAEGTDPEPPIPEDEALPIVFVHGFSGSAQQFTSQAIRFIANGFPPERMRAYEHDGAGMGTNFVPGLDEVVDEVRATFGTEKVFLIGHSRGTAVSGSYLSDPGRAAKVEKYIALDGAGCANISVPCIAPAQSTNMRAGQTHPIPGQKHVEVATSKESFAFQFEFLFGREAKVLDIVKQRAPVVISGRAVNAPANTGREGSVLEVWELKPNSGMRAGTKPVAKFDIGADGQWGPVTVDPDKHYELVLSSPGSAYQHHFYEQPFLRSTEFIRLRSGPSDSPARMHTNTGDHHASVTVSRMREWMETDVLEVSTESESGDGEARDVLTAFSNENGIAIFLHDDAATPGESTLALLPWFPEQAFQTGVDIVMPAADTPDGTITLKNIPRGDTDKPQTLRVANWASTNHTVNALFADFPHP